MRPDASADFLPAPRLTVVMLTYNRLTEASHSLERLLAHNPGIPVVVVDNGSSDGTAAILGERFPQVTVVACPVNLGAAGRNAGAEQVHTDYLAFCDDDTWWEDNALHRAIALLDAYPSAGVLSGKVIVGEDGEPDPTCELMARSPLSAEGLPGPGLIGFMAGAAIFRTPLYRQLGGYAPELFIGGEEELLALDVMCAGWRIAYAPMLTLRHLPSQVRDGTRRRQLLARNAVWVALMRLPAPFIWQRALTALKAMARNRTLWIDGADTLRGIPHALRTRSVINTELQEQIAVVRRSEHK